MDTMALRSFMPSEQLTGGTNGSRNNTAGNYKGDATLPANIGSHVPDHKNTSVWITGLPPVFGYQELLDHITAYKIGRVRSTNINAPTPACPSSAATVSFFRRQDAEVLFRIIRERKMVIRGSIYPHVQWNRYKVMEEQGKRFVSRVLLIAGYPSFVNPQELTAFFDRKFCYQLDTIIDHGTVEGEMDPVGQTNLIARIEFRFSSWRNQASFGYMALTRELGDLVMVEYGIDPCGN